MKLIALTVEQFRRPPYFKWHPYKNPYVTQTINVETIVSIESTETGSGSYVELTNQHTIKTSESPERVMELISA